MSDKFVRSVNVTDQSNRQSVQSYESVWMAHWMRTRCDATEQTRHPIETKTFKIVNGSLKISSKSMGNEGMQSSLLCDRDTDNMLASRAVFYNLRRGKASNGEGTSKNPLKWFKTDHDAKHGNFAMPKSLREIFVQSSSNIIPYGFDLEKYESGKEKTAIVFKQLPNATMNVHERKMDFQSESNNGHCFLHKMGNCVHDVETMRIFRSTRVITEINGNASFFGHGNRGVKLQPLSSSTDNEEKELVGDVKACKVTARSESSAETNTIDMNSFTTSVKALNTTIPDINLELPASLSENTCPSSSKTQSLDMGEIFTNANHPKPKTNLNLENSQEPGNRWVKRLKLNSSNLSAQGTKSSDFSENLSHAKMSKLFSRVLKTGNTSEEPLQSHKEDEKKKPNELLLSHAWIQRWLSNRSRSSEKKGEAVVVCEPQSSKLSVENLQKEQFPSIAAMALMGKAITGFQPCELQNRGAFTVWNTKAF